MKNIYTYIALAFATIAAVSCKTESASTRVPVTSLEISPTSIECIVGDTPEIKATIKPDDATDKGVIWISSDEKVALVDNAGKVTAKEPGSATITAITSDGCIEKTCSLTVYTGKPSVKAKEATEITSTSALLSADLNTAGCEFKTVECGFNLYLDGVLVKTLAAKETSVTDKFSADAKELKCITEYEFEPLVKLDGNTTIGERMPFTTLEYEAPDKAGMNVKGVVYDNVTGKPIKDVVVSDGWQCVQTDNNGCYYMNSNLTKAWNVFAIIPESYDTEFNEKLSWSGYKALDAAKAVNSCNFALTPKSGDLDKCRVILNGDPQPFTSASPHSIRSWMEVARDINDYSKTVNQRLYQIVLGDMVTNQIEVPGIADKYYFKYLQTCGVRTFHIPGNHDHKQTAATYEESIKDYSNTFGPYNYAFNLAGVHFIMLDDCIWEASKTYNLGVNEENLAFVESDLKFVPKTKPLVICTHGSLTKWYGGRWPSCKNFDKLTALLNGYDVHFFYGHGHINMGWDITPAEIATYAPGVKSMSGILINRSCGCWCCSDDICKEGSPRGFVELDINKDDVMWQFHSLIDTFDDVTFTDNFSFYIPGKFVGLGTSAKDNMMYCNVYIWDNAWKLPELWIGGTKAATFASQGTSAYDPLYQKWFPIWESMNIPGWRNTDGSEGPSADCSHLFGVVPPTSHGTGEIRVTDRFGRTYSTPVTW